MFRSITALIGITLTCTLTPAPAQADSPIWVRDQHQTSSWTDVWDFCGYPIDVAAEGTWSRWGRTAHDITIPEHWLYGMVMTQEDQTLTTASGSLTQTHHYLYVDQAGSYSDTDGVVTSLFHTIETVTLRTEDGRTLASASGPAVVEATATFDPDTQELLDYSEETIREEGQLGTYFDGFCDTAAPYLA